MRPSTAPSWSRDLRPDLAILPDSSAACLEPATPAFIRRLGAGLGLAEDPGAAESFGAHRRLLLAEGILDGHEHGCTSVADGLEAVVGRFAPEGLNLDVPYLSPGSSDLYAPMPQ